MKRTISKNEIDMDTFVGKTISKVDTTATNCVTFWFTDGTSACLEAENAGYGLGLSAYEVSE